MYGLMQLPGQILGTLCLVAASIILYIVYKNKPSNRIPLFLFSISLYTTSLLSLINYFNKFSSIEPFLFFGSMMIFIVAIVINQSISYKENKKLWVKRIYQVLAIFIFSILLIIVVAMIFE